jgi:hypothetical protein
LGVRDQRVLSDFNPGGTIHLDALIPDIFWFSKDYCGLIEEKKRPSRQIFVRPATLAVISDLFCKPPSSTATG